jgi:hypothetical protein
MKKKLLLMMCCPVILAAQNGNGVTLSNLAVNAGTVTFNVSWKNTGMPALWSDSVWVFVDYNKAGKMERLLLSGATLTAPSWSAATVIFGKDGNNQGAWVVGNARSAGSFSAKVQLHTATADLAGVCAYASNYPPVGEYIAPNTLKFTGTPMYNLVLKHLENTTDIIYRVSGAVYDLPENYTLASFTDATGAPGIFPDINARPPMAVSDTTWSIGGQTWSDVIYYAPKNCQLVEKPSSSTSTPEYVHADGKTYYNYACAVAIADIICPTPWRAPVIADGNIVCSNYTKAQLKQLWLRGKGRYTPSSTNLDNSGDVNIWHMDSGCSGCPSHLHTGTSPCVSYNYPATWCYQQRCVK